MDKTNGGKASDFDRRASMRTSVRLSVVDGVESHDMPPFATDNGPSDDDTPSAPPSLTDGSSTPPTLHIPENLPSQRIALPRPSSIAKPSRANTDSNVVHAERTLPPTAGSISSRLSNTSSQSSALWQESPYRGPSGPSHPYAMYPQRTMSMATASTEPVSDRSYDGPTGPTHPYGMYNQGIEPTDPVEVEAQHIPVGFLGNRDGYQRQIGPEGEEVGDLIGPLGHTEELPPYSRYPEASYARKSGDAAQPPPPNSAPPVIGATVVPEPLSTQPIPGAGGIGLATRNPEFASSDDLNSPTSRLSTRSFTSDSNHEINTAARTVTEKPTQKKWQARAKRKMWGIIPYWAICLLAVGIALMGIILGAVIGTFLAKHKRPPSHHNDDAEPQTSPTPMADVQPLQTVPPGLPMLTTGIFSLPPLITSQAPNTCFNISTQAQAWTCGVGFTYYFLEIDVLLDQPSTSQFALKLTTPGYNGSSAPRLTWGMQPPLIPDPVKLILVNDTAEPYRGPAWWMQISYNKTVVLAENKFPGPNGVMTGSSSTSASSPTATAATKRSAKKRGGFPGGGPGGGPGGFKRKGLAGAQPGDKPWICTWPGTVLEAFIYPSQNNSWKPFTGNPWPSSTTSLPTTSQSSAPSERFTAPSRDTDSNPQRTSSSSPTASNSAAPPDWTPQPQPPAYPKVIKFEERRYPGSGSTTASCRQVQVSDDGQNFMPVLDSSGRPIEVVIVENKDDGESPFNNRRWLGDVGLQIRDVQPADQLSDCGCIWWFT